MARYVSRTRPGLLSLLLAAVMLRLLVPAGFMIAADTTGAPALVLCDGVAPEPAVAPTQAMHAMHHAPRHDPAHHRAAPCPYAALAAPVLPPLPAAFAPQAPVAAEQPPPALVARADPGAAAPTPPATGPPLSA
jgi:hypothetical protein